MTEYHHFECESEEVVSYIEPSNLNLILKFECESHLKVISLHINIPITISTIVYYLCYGMMTIRESVIALD